MRFIYKRNNFNNYLAFGIFRNCRTNGSSPVEWLPEGLWSNSSVGSGNADGDDDNCQARRDPALAKQMASNRPLRERARIEKSILPILPLGGIENRYQEEQLAPHSGADDGARQALSPNPDIFKSTLSREAYGKSRFQAIPRKTRNPLTVNW